MVDYPDFNSRTVPSQESASEFVSFRGASAEVAIPAYSYVAIRLDPSALGWIVYVKTISAYINATALMPMVVKLNDDVIYEMYCLQGHIADFSSCGFIPVLTDDVLDVWIGNVSASPIMGTALISGYGEVE